MNHFVYILKTPQDRIFYVGKGTRHRRVLTHKAEAKKGHNCHKCNLIRKLWTNGEDYTYTIVFESDSEEEVFVQEKALIKFHGRKNLTNLTDGGEGMVGYVPTEATRALHSRIHRGNKYNLGRIASLETRAKISASHKGIPRSQETRIKISIGQKGKPSPMKGIPLSEEHKAKLSKALMGRPVTQKQIDSARSHKGQPLSEPHRKSISNGLKGHTISEETRAKISNSNMGNKNGLLVKHRPGNRKPFIAEHRQKLSESAQRRGINPATRKKIADAQRGKPKKRYDPPNQLHLGF